MDQSDRTTISIPFSDAVDRHLRIAVGACRFRFGPGAGEAWVTGTYDDPSDSLPIQAAVEGGTARIYQEQRLGDLFGFFNRPPRLDLALGTAQPYALTLETGASEGEMDLGGLPITRLVVKQGAGKNTIRFAAPNPQPMSLIEIGGGAVGLDLENLANAHFAEMRVEGGAAAYTLDFGGTLRRDAHVRVTTGMSSVEIRIPAATPAKVLAESVLGNVDATDGLTTRDGAFWTAPALSGGSPLLTISVNVAIGSLKLRLT